MLPYEDNEMSLQAWICCLNLFNSFLNVNILNLEIPLKIFRDMSGFKTVSFCYGKNTDDILWPWDHYVPDWC